MPEDFSQRVHEMDVKELCVHYEAGWATVKRWRDAIGHEVKRYVDFPSDINELAKTMTIADIARHMGINGKGSFHERLRTLHPEAHAMAKANGLKQSRERAASFAATNAKIPEGFPVNARSMSIREAARHYDVSKDRIRVWARIAGEGLLEAMAANGVEASKRASAARRKEIAAKKAARPEMALTERVMTHIRRASRFVVHSDRIYGGTGDVYYVGNQRMDWDGLLGVARRYGYMEA